MKNKTYTRVMLIYVAMCMALMAILIVQDYNLKSAPKPAVQTVIAPVASPRQEIWISALEWCESGGNPNAINPKDRDNTPSYGAFQFKPGTFAMLEKKYDVTGLLMDPVAQRTIVEHMINDKSMDIHWQFPGCTKKIGLPPVLQ